MVKKFNKPDLNAPRYRPKKLNICNQNFYEKFIQDNPKYSGISVSQFKDVIKTFNGQIWKQVVDCRDGVELPEQLGYLFIGTCQRRKKISVDYKKSADCGVNVQNQNWESDNYMAKIFYTNFETRYRFKHHDLWGFTAVRDFKRTVAATYPVQWKMYVVVDSFMKISKLFRLYKYKEYKKQETITLLETYDEFNLD